MDKISRHIITITIIETWTIIWADGTERTVVYRAGQQISPLPACPTDAPGAPDLAAMATNARQYSAPTPKETSASLAKSPGAFTG